jgi:hypothetical protein
MAMTPAKSATQHPQRHRTDKLPHFSPIAIGVLGMSQGKPHQHLAHKAEILSPTYGQHSLRNWGKKPFSYAII